MKSMQVKVLDRIESDAEAERLEAVVSYDYNNVGKINVIDPKTLESRVLITFDFQTDYVRSAVVRAGEKITARGTMIYSYVPDGTHRTLSDLLDLIRSTVAAVKAEVVV